MASCVMASHVYRQKQSSRHMAGCACDN